MLMASLRKVLLGAAVGSTCVACAACGGSGSGPSGGGATSATIPVTLVGDETGAAAYAGKEVLKGMKVALEQVNDSGELDGKKLVLTVKDTGSDQGNATAMMSQAVRSDAVAVFGPAVSSEALATAPIAQAAKVVDIATLSQSEGLLQTGAYIYRLTPSELRYDPLIAGHLAKLGVKTVNIVYASDIPTQIQEAKNMKRWLGTLGIKVGLSIGIPAATTDYSSIATRAQQGRPDAIDVLMLGSGISSLTKSLRSSGYKGQLFSGQAATAGALVPAGAAANGMLYAVLYHPDLPYASSRKFTAAFAQAYPGTTPTSFAATGYDAMTALGRAIAKSGSATREGVLKGMQMLAATDGFNGASGPVEFVAPDNRDVTAGGALVQWRDGKEHLILRGTPGLESQPLERR